jgi:hypothetical protein
MRDIDADNLFHVSAVEREVEPGTETQFEDAAARSRCSALPVGARLCLTHREMCEAWQDTLGVDTHLG